MAIRDRVSQINCIVFKPEVKIILSHEHTEFRWLIFEESLVLIKYDSNKEGFRKLWKILNK